MRPRAFAVSTLMVVSMLLHAASAEAAGVTTTIFPARVHLSQGQTSTVSLIVSNGETDALRRLALSIMVDGSGVSASRVGAITGVIRPGAAALVHIRVTTPRLLLTGIDVNFVLTYTDSALGVGVATLEVDPPRPLNPPSIATMAVDATLGAVESGDTTPMYLVLTNHSAQSLAVGPIAFDLPSFLKRTTQTPLFVKLAPYQSQPVSIMIKADTRVRPGKHEIVVTAPIRVGPAGQTFSLTAAQEATVEVQGGTALLTVFGIPALFLLPGLLLVGIPAALWNIRLLRHRSDARSSLAVDLKSPAVIGLGVVLSFVMVFFYWKAVRVDLFDYYGLPDIVELLTISAVTGVVLYTIPMAVRFWLQARKTPKASDGPIQILRKLGRQQLSTRLPTYLENGHSIYALQRPDLDRASSWLSPGIELEWMSGDHSELAERVAAARDNDRDPDKLARLLAQGQASSALSVRWIAWPGVDGPFLSPHDKLGTIQQADAILHYKN